MRCACSTALGVLLLLVFANPGGAATTPAQRCAATKRKLAGKELAALTLCDAKAAAKAVAVDPLCESKARGAFATAWAKAEAKKGGCSTTHDQAIIGSLVDQFRASLQTALQSAGVASTCAAAKLRAAGKKGACELGCSATAARTGASPGDPKLARCLAGCSARLRTAFVKAEAKKKGACHTTGDAARIQTAIDAGFFVATRDDLVACPTGLIGCSGGCIDPSTDASDCGSCGNVCGRNEACRNGGCACDAPLKLCPIQVVRPAAGSSPSEEAIQVGLNPCAERPCECTDVTDDRENCGACGTVCPANANVCLGGTCACPSPNVVCGPFCTDTASDRANCGSCGHVCPSGDPYCVSGTCSPTTTLYPQSNALDRPVFEALSAFAHDCVSIFLDDTQNECGGCFDGGSSCCLADVCCNEEDHHQGIARTPELSDGSIYFFLSHSGVQGRGDTGRLMQFRYAGVVQNEHVAEQGKTATLEQRLLLADETHPSAIAFLPDVNHYDAGYLFVAKEYDAQKVTVYFWEPGSNLQPIGDVAAGLTKPSHVLIDRVGDDYYLVVLDNTFKNGSPYRAHVTDLFPSDVKGAMNVSAFQPLPYFTFTGDLGSQAQLVRVAANTTTTWNVLVYNSPDDDGFGNDYVHVWSIDFGDTVTLRSETSVPTAFFFPAGGTSFTNSGTHYVDRNGRILISSSERWAQDEGEPFGWESRVDECEPAN